MNFKNGRNTNRKYKEFFYNYINEICKNVTIKENAADTIKRLVEKGHKIIFITSRGEKRFKGSEKTTLEYLKKYNIEYSDIIFNSFEKQIDCQNNNIDIMIDDSVKNCELVSKSGIRTILYTSYINKAIETDIERVESWREIENKIDA